MDIEQLGIQINEQMLQYLGVLFVSVTVGFFSGHQLSKDRSISTDEGDDENQIVRETPDPTAPNPQVSIVPSPDAIWRDVRQDVVSLVGGGESKNFVSATRLEGTRAKKRPRRPISKTKLGLQALSASARRQLAIHSLDELRLCIASFESTEKDADSALFQEGVFKAILEAYKTTGKRWLGYEPTYSPAASTDSKGEDDDDLEDEIEGMRELEGEWILIQEKLPIYAVVVKYLRFPPQPAEPTPPLLKAEKSDVNRDEPLEVLPEIHVSSDADESALQQSIKEEENLQTATSHGWREGCLVTLSTEITEDMVLNIAELIALEYLSYLRSGGIFTPRVSGSLTQAGWPLALKSSLHNTRTLERFRNQIVFGWWLHRNLYSVIAIFEDYHYLWGIQDGRFIRRKCFVRRSQELSNLQGWRLGVSYFLEAVDAAEPLVKAFVQRLGDVISFLLVTLIGRSLGLILKGIQSSVQVPWGKPNKP